MEPGAVVPGDAFHDGPLRPARVSQALVSVSSPLSEEKKLSASALFQLACPADRERDLVICREVP
jgi:hypothetical protein